MLYSRSLVIHLKYSSVYLTLPLPPNFKWRMRCSKEEKQTDVGGDASVYQTHVRTFLYIMVFNVFFPLNTIMISLFIFGFEQLNISRYACTNVCTCFQEFTQLKI